MIINFNDMPERRFPGVNNGFYTLCAGAIKNALRTRLLAEELPNCMANIKAEYRRIVAGFPEVGKNTLTDMAYLGCLFLAIYTGSGKRFARNMSFGLCHVRDDAQPPCTHDHAGKRRLLRLLDDGR